MNSNSTTCSLIIAMTAAGSAISFDLTCVSGMDADLDQVFRGNGGVDNTAVLTNFSGKALRNNAVEG